MLANIHFQKWPLQFFDNFIYESDKGSLFDFYGEITAPFGLKVPNLVRL